MGGNSAWALSQFLIYFTFYLLTWNYFKNLYYLRFLFSIFHFLFSSRFKYSSFCFFNAFLTSFFFMLLAPLLYILFSFVSNFIFLSFPFLPFPTLLIFHFIAHLFHFPINHFQILRSSFPIDFIALETVTKLRFVLTKST